MILSPEGTLLELRNYNGEFAHPAFYVYEAGIDAWLSTFRVARKHDVIPVIQSTGRRAYFENQLARHGYTTINGQIPTPIISWWITDYQRVPELDRPREIKYHNRTDDCLYPDMIPFNVNITISIWTRKQQDMKELESQFHANFNNGGLRWIEFKDNITQRKQFTPFIIENRSNVSNLEPGESDQPLLRVDYALKSEMHFPLPGAFVPKISKVYIDIDVSGKENNMPDCEITYISGEVDSSKVNKGKLCGLISPGLVYFSGTVNAGQVDEEYVMENHQWGFNPL